MTCLDSPVDGPSVARPSFISLIPGGPQEFPNDPLLEAIRQNHRPVNPKRIPKTQAFDRLHRNCPHKNCNPPF